MGIAMDDYYWDLTSSNVVVNNLSYWLTNGSHKYFDGWFGQRARDIRKADVIIFNDGPDVNPLLCKQRPLGSTIISDYSKELDKEEIAIYFDNLDTPKIGIGRGALLLGVLNGASLIQYVDQHFRGHNIITSDGDMIEATGWHDKLLNIQKCKNAQLLAWSHESSMYRGAENLIIPANVDFQEPEIVYFRGTKSLCIQGRPDWPKSSTEYVDYINGLIEEIIYDTL